jgi:hypothetical protein
MISEFIVSGRPVNVEERPKLHGFWRVEKFRDGKPVGEAKTPNCPLNVGLRILLDLGFGLGGTAFASGTSRIGCGNDGTVADPTQTALIGGTTHYEGMDTSFPSRASQTVTVRATFAAGHGTQEWRELVFDNGTTALIRLAYNFGTKGVGDVWVVTGTFTLS